MLHLATSQFSKTSSLPPPPTLHADTIAYQSLITSNGGTITTTHLEVIDTAIKALYDAGLRSYYLEFNPLAGDSLLSAVCKVWYPAGTPDKLILNGSWSGSNYSLTGGLNPGSGNTSRWVETGHNLVVNGWTTAQANLSFWSGDNTIIQNSGDFTAGSSAASYIGLQCNYGGTSYVTCWDDNNSWIGWGSAGNPTSCLFQFSRTATNSMKMFRNGVQVAASSNQAGTLPDASLKLFIDVYNDKYSSRPCLFYGYSSVGIPDNLQVTNYNIILAMMQGLGRA